MYRRRIELCHYDYFCSSDWFEYGFIVYGNNAKQALLDVKAVSLERYGAVSEIVAKELAENALKKAKAQLGVSITGIAGPTGGTEEKPVGTVWIGLAGEGIAPNATHFLFQGDRQSVREQAMVAALKMMIRVMPTFEEQRI